MKHPALHISSRQRANFETLGISPTTDFSVVRAAFKAKALALHPDKSHDPTTIPGFRDAKQALDELNFLKEFPVLSTSAMTREEMVAEEEEGEEEEAAREALAREEEQRTKDRMAKKQSEAGTYAFAAAATVTDNNAPEVGESPRKRTSGMPFVLKKKKQTKEHVASGQHPPAQTQRTTKKKHFSTARDNLDRARAHTSANIAADNAHAGGRHTYDDFFETFGGADWGVGEDWDRDDGYEDMKEQRRRG